MNITKLILLACPIVLASILLVANPARASSLKPAPATQIIMLGSTQQITEFATLKFAQASNPIIDQLGCNCANCTQAKLQVLQGKLPSVSF